MVIPTLIPESGRIAMNREVNVTKRVQTSKGPRYCPVVLSANGRVKPDAVLVNGKPERHTEGAYYPRMARRRQACAPVGREGCRRRQCAKDAQGSRTQRGQQWRGYRARERQRASVGCGIGR